MGDTDFPIQMGGRLPDQMAGKFMRDPAQFNPRNLATLRGSASVRDFYSEHPRAQREKPKGKLDRQSFGFF